ncbi:MFS transporter [bacterium]|jgi:MFS family permease|nr:MFS transporter [bacterium]MBT3582110.1 MFS transporter [bacterium]MBT4552156.1 MFS transporter [bacterium]MBT7087863.1 MFS transporter [bacterium]
MFQPTLSSNIWKLYLIKALTWFLVMMPIMVLFLQDNGLSMTQVLLLQVAFSAAVVLFEVPSGYFSDRLSRRVSIIIGSFLSFLAFFIYSLSFGFFGFLVAELILGLAVSFISGADSALLYDTLLSLQKSQEYKKLEGRFSAIGNFSESSAGILGGFLALISLRFPLYIETLVILLAVPVAFSLVEPVRHKAQHATSSWKSILKIVKYSLHDHAEIKWLILYSAVIAASTFTMVWFIQPYWQMVGVPLILFGVLWAALNASVGLFSIWAHRLENMLGRKKSLMSLIFFIAIAYFLLGVFQSIWAIAFMFIIYFVRGINTPIIKDYINQRISSDIRATVLSVQSLAFRLVFCIVGPLIGWLNDLYSLKVAFLSASAIFLFFGLVSLFFLHKHQAL